MGAFEGIPTELETPDDVRSALLRRDPTPRTEPDSLGCGVPRDVQVAELRQRAAAGIRAAIESTEQAYAAERRHMGADLVLALRALAEREGLIEPLVQPSLEPLRAQLARVETAELEPDDVQLGFGESAKWDTLHTPDGELRPQYVMPPHLRAQMDRREFVRTVLHAERRVRGAAAAERQAADEAAALARAAAPSEAPPPSRRTKPPRDDAGDEPR